MIEKLNSNFKMIDMFKHYQGKHPVTFGDHDERVLTTPHDVGTLQCLDYIFEILFEEEVDEVGFL
jgi:hypothetical protein